MVQTRGKRLASLETPKPSSTHFPSSPTNSVIRAIPRSVFLDDWWLIKIDGKGLGVGGFDSRVSLGVRVFTSAEISVRHCGTILETADGITIRIGGLINMSRTHQNGFPPEICNKFMHGFPYNWEEYAASCCRHEESNCVGTSPSTRTSDDSSMFSEKIVNNSSPSLNDLPVTTIRDLLLSTLGHSSYDSIIKNICSDALRTSGRDCSGHSGAFEDSNSENKSPVGNEKSVANATPIIQKKAKSGSRRRPNRDNVPATQPRVTRSMSRMKLLSASAAK